MKLSRVSKLRMGEFEVKPYMANKRGIQEKRKRFSAARILLIFLVFAAPFLPHMELKPQ